MQQAGGMADWIGVDVDKATRETTCGHYPYSAKGLCKKCYNAARYSAHAEQERTRMRERPPLTEEQKARKKVTRRALYERNRDLVAEQSRAWAKANPERRREAERARYARSPRSDKKRAADKAWRKANADLRLFQMQRRRARQQGAESDLTPSQWAEIKAEFDGACAYCGRSDLPLELEHMIPLCRGGNHTASNVIPSCPPCNGKKGRKTAAEFIGWEIPPRRQTDADHR